MMKITMHAYSTVLTCCLLLTLAAGDTLIVAMDGTGTDCTLDDPCGSIQQAIDIAQAGGKIQIGAGTFVENLTLNITKTGLSIEGRSMSETIIESAGGNEGQMAPAGVPVDIIVDIFATDVKIANMMLVHPEAEATKRDIGVFVRPPALNTVLESINVQRSRTGDNVEPFAPGSRGLLVLQATGKSKVAYEISSHHNNIFGQLLIFVLKLSQQAPSAVLPSLKEIMRIIFICQRRMRQLQVPPPMGQPGLASSSFRKHQIPFPLEILSTAV